MTTERYTSEQVLAFLHTEELEDDFLGGEFDGQEVFMEGSDDECHDLEEMDEGKLLLLFFFKPIYSYIESDCMDIEKLP